LTCNELRIFETVKLKETKNIVEKERFFKNPSRFLSVCFDSLMKIGDEGRKEMNELKKIGEQKILATFP